VPLLVKKPISVLDKAITVSWRETVLALGKSISHFASGKTHELATDFAQLAASVGLAHDVGEVAWLLIRRSLLRALADLIRDHRDLFRIDAPDRQELDSFELSQNMDFEVLELDHKFFTAPGSLELLDRLQEPLCKWFEMYGVPHIAASAVAARMRPYFVLALHDEWMRSPSDYAELRDAVDTPFTRAQDLERAWLRYEAHLWRVVNEPMFAEAFGLKSVYVPLRAYWERQTSHDGDRKVVASLAECEESRVTRVVVQLPDALDNWLASNKKDDAIRVVSGGPGSGKSSFTRMYAAETMTKGAIRVLYVPLHLFDPKGDLVASVGEYVRTSRVLPCNPLEVNSGEEPRRLFIIFDGLDELAMQGKLAAETAQQFVREVDRTLDKLNQMKPWLSVLISGRELTIQANACEFRKPGQILQLLPYAIEPTNSAVNSTRSSPFLSERWIWEDKAKLLAKDQRKEWWFKYRNISGIGPDDIPEELLQGELAEITSQPLLLYLVALSYARKRLSLGASTNLNDVYGDLIDAVWARAYEGRPFRAIQSLTKSQFIRVLEEIGLAAWHDERRTTTIKTIREHFETASLTSTLEAFQQGAESGVTRLLTAFYFRQHGERDGEKTFEFTHKSFGEYLAACRIVRTISVIDLAMTEHERDPDLGKDVVDSLATWADICGPAPLDEYYVRFLNREISRRTPEQIARWQKRLGAMISTATRIGTPVERVRPRPPTFHDELRRARNAEEALFACASACGDVTMEPTNVEWPTKVAAGTWIRRLQGQRSGAANAIITESLRWLNLTECTLDIIDLYGGRLDGAILARSRFRSACLEGANLVGADLRGTNFHLANLDRANLSGANLEGAVLGHPSFAEFLVKSTSRPKVATRPLSVASYLGTNFQGANLKDANLVGLDLVNANLTDANLQGANTTAAKLKQSQNRKRTK
jgi:hypothetical protein